MDELQDWELDLLMDGHGEVDRNSWEQTRWLMYTMLAPYQKKGSKIKATDIISFPWDEGYKPANIEVTNDEVARLSKHAEIMGQIIKEQKKKKKKKNGKC